MQCSTTKLPMPMLARSRVNSSFQSDARRLLHQFLFFKCIERFKVGGIHLDSEKLREIAAGRPSFDRGSVSVCFRHFRLFGFGAGTVLSEECGRNALIEGRSKAYVRQMVVRHLAG